MQEVDATGADFTARADGATVVGPENGGVFQVVAAYPTMTIETYLFYKPGAGRSMLA